MLKATTTTKTGCNLWGITGLLNTSLPLALPCSCSADLDARCPSPPLQGSDQCPDLDAPPRNLHLCSFLRKQKATREGRRAPIEFFTSSVNVNKNKTGS